jgi:hypothetical protein
MGIFGKKKKEIKETTTAPTEDEVTSSVMPTQITKEKTHQPQPTKTQEPPQISVAEEERLHYLEEVITDLNWVHALPPDSITQMGEIPNLLFAIYTELREIRKLLEKTTEEK